MSIKEMLREEIERIPEEIAFDIYSYLHQINNGNEIISYSKITQSLSEASFAKIWDNEEDAVYDRL